MKRLKIDVITMDAVPNYGSVLQAFATQTFLEAHGCDVTIIDYARENVRYENLLHTWSNGNPLKAFVMIPTIQRWKHVFRSFRNDKLHLSDRQYSTDDDFKSYPLTADAYCTGSDQVWNSKWNNGIIKPLYLSFVPDNEFKFAFAASFGQESVSYNEVSETKSLIQAYRYISVREKTGVHILESQYGYQNPVHLIDPTLYLTSKEWREYATPVKVKEPYILIYNLNRSREFDQYAVALSKKTGMRLLRICTRYDQFYRPGKSILIPKVFDFISLIDNATYVLTDSFHATAFSMNMGTEPICIYPQEFGGRIEGFLKTTESLQRHVENYKDFDVINRPVDFNVVNTILDRERIKTENWINDVLLSIRCR